jgi:CubicO group peptidase (beta-lactamase class C family)
MAATRAGPIYAGAFGRRAMPDGAPMTTDTVFWIASMTKAITSAAAMQLVDQGMLELDRPIADVLPELAALQVLEGFDVAGEPRLRPAKRPITLRHLLTHTAGFVYDIWNAEMSRYMERPASPASSLARMRRWHCRWCSSRARNGITASTSTGSVRRSSGRAVRSSAIILPSTCSHRSAWWTPCSS